MSQTVNEPETLQEEASIILKKHDWNDPEIVWRSYYHGPILISNYALRFICKDCLEEIIGLMGSEDLNNKLNDESCHIENVKE